MKQEKVIRSISFDPDVYDGLNKAAKAERSSMSGFLNRLLAAILIENKTRLND